MDDMTVYWIVVALSTTAFVVTAYFAIDLYITLGKIEKILDRSRHQ
jgi:hypothetical protein